MLYQYKCEHCDIIKDIVKPHTKSAEPEFCGAGHEMRKLFSPPQLMAIKTEDAYFSASLGKPVRNSRHERAEAKARGWEEVGNERPEKHLAPQLKEYPNVGDLLNG